MYKVRFKCSFCDDKKKKNNDSDKDKIYVDSTGGRFKDRYTGHKYNFKRVNKKKITRSSDFVWQHFYRYGTKTEMYWSIL